MAATATGGGDGTVRTAPTPTAGDGADGALLGRPPGDRAVLAGEAALIAGIGAFHVLDHRRLPGHLQLGAHVAMAGASILTALALGATVDDLGLTPARIPAGLRRGALDASVTVAALGLATCIPALEPLLTDPRVADLDGAEVARRALLEIPVGTVLYEELVFRSALLAIARRRIPHRHAVLTTSLVFGLWHILPALDDRVHHEEVGRYPLVATVAPTVAVTALAGAAMTRARLRSGSVVAPMLVHLASNVGGLLAATVVSRRARRRQAADGPPSRSAAPEGAPA